MQIDKYNENLSTHAVGDKKTFYDTLKQAHPRLSRLELEMCGHLRLNLSSKEIASLMNLSDGSVRVYKTRIKQKFQLKDGEKIEDYIKQYTVIS